MVLVDKPVGPTSFDVVRAARRGFSGRVGHAGTLDPFASGLLVVLLGQATRLTPLFLGLQKEYELTVQFGAVSTTGDPTGEIKSTGSRVEGRSIVTALGLFRGLVRQKVPLTSAVKVGGEALYKKAHRGETVDTPERDVAMYDVQLVAFYEEAQQARLVALTGSGAYLRVLAEDLGAATGAGGYASALRRTRIGRFGVDDALGLEDLGVERYAEKGGGVLELGEALDLLPSLVLDPAQARLASNGNQLPVAREGRFRAYDGQRLLGVFEGRGGVARPLVVFPGGV